MSEHYWGYRSSGLKCCAIAGLTRPRRGALITLILLRCRLRVGDATRLSYDGLVTDPRGAPYLRYVNHQMNREALVPVDEQMRALITAQQARLGDGHTPPRAGRHGQGHFPTQQAALKTLHLVTRGMHPKGTGAARWTMRWKPALNAFAVTFANRMPAAENSNRRTPEPPFVGQSVTSLRAPLLPGPDRS